MMMMMNKDCPHPYKRRVRRPGTEKLLRPTNMAASYTGIRRRERVVGKGQLPIES